MNETHLLLADRDGVFPDPFLRYASSEGFIVHRAMDSRELLSFIELYPSGEALIDLGFCGSGLYALLRRIRAKSGMPVLLIADTATGAEKALALESGADDFMLRPIDDRELSARLKVRLRERGNMDCAQSAVLRYGDLTLDADSLTLRKGSATLNVTLTEYKLLVKLMRSPGKTFSKRELYAYIDCAGGHARDTLRSDDNTIMVHISKLRDKIEDDPRDPRYIKTVRGQGYRFDIP